MKYLVIGGSGFVGSKLISVLGEDCYNLDKNRSEFFDKITIIGDVETKKK